LYSLFRRFVSASQRHTLMLLTKRSRKQQKIQKRMEFNVRLRSECGGNPGTAFHSGECCNQAIVGNKSCSQKTGSLGRRSSHPRCKRSSFQGYSSGLCWPLHGLISFRRLWYLTASPTAPHPTFDAHLRQLHPEMWLRELQDTVEMGICIRKTSPDDPVQKYGRIKKWAQDGIGYSSRRRSLYSWVCRETVLPAVLVQAGKAVGSPFICE